MIILALILVLVFIRFLFRVFILSWSLKIKLRLRFARAQFIEHPQRCMLLNLLIVLSLWAIVGPITLRLLINNILSIRIIVS